MADRVDGEVEAALAEAKRMVRQAVGNDRAVVRIMAGIAALIVAIGGVIVLQAVVRDHVRDESLERVVTVATQPVMT